jgi:hypothetical protein
MELQSNPHDTDTDIQIVDKETKIEIYNAEKIHIDLSALDDVTAVISDQDFSQRYNVVSSVILELYRVITCSLLILFVPQKCNGQVCSISQNMTLADGFYNMALVFNFITLAVFCPLYYIEIVRENRLIKYLDVNTVLSNDDSAVEQNLAILPYEKQSKIIEIDKQYQKVAYLAIFIYCLNALFSGIVVFDYYLSSQTASVYITYVLFIMSKLINVYTIANTPKHTFYSAYLKSSVQYNDIDADLKRNLTIVNKVEDIVVDKTKI